MTTSLVTPTTEWPPIEWCPILNEIHSEQTPADVKDDLTQQVIIHITSGNVALHELNEKGHTLLDAAAVRGLTPIVRAILSMTRPADEVTKALFWAARNAAPVELLQSLLNANADPRNSTLMPYKRTPLHFAACSSKPNSSRDVIELLLSAGADPLALDAQKNSALTLAAGFADTSEPVRTLLKYDATINLEPSKGAPISAMYIAALSVNVSVLDILLADERANKGAIDSEGYTVLDLFSQTLKANHDTSPDQTYTLSCNGITRTLTSDKVNAMIQKLAPDDINWVDFLGHNTKLITIEPLIQHSLNQGANPDILLQHAGATNATSAMQLLLNQNANPNATSPCCKSSSLHKAAHKGYLRALKLLLANDADPKAALAEELTCDEDDASPGYLKGATAIHLAVASAGNCGERPNSEIIKALIRSGGDPQARNLNGQTPWDLLQKVTLTGKEHTELEEVLSTRTGSHFQYKAVTTTAAFVFAVTIPVLSLLARSSRCTDEAAGSSYFGTTPSWEDCMWSYKS